MFRLFFVHCAIPRISQIGMAMEKSTYEGIFYDFLQLSVLYLFLSIFFPISVEGW